MERRFNGAVCRVIDLHTAAISVDEQKDFIALYLARAKWPWRAMLCGDPCLWIGGQMKLPHRTPDLWQGASLRYGSYLRPMHVSVENHNFLSFAQASSNSFRSPRDS